MMEKFTFEHAEVGKDFRVTAPMQEAFQKWGCLLVRGLFSAEEMAELKKCFDTESFQKEVFTRGTGKDGGFQMALWWQPGDDTCGLITRCRRLVDTLQLLLGGHQVYHLSSKMIMKAAQSGGAFSWHQDYGYFYENGIPTPACGSVSLPIDRCYRENGALQVVPGSHLLGRQVHGRAGDLAGVPASTMDQITRRLGDPVVCETQPGDCLFFHSNVLHSSGPNTSLDKRWNLVLAYNQVQNAPLTSGFLPPPQPLILVEDEDVLAKARAESTISKMYMVHADDTSTEKLE